MRTTLKRGIGQAAGLNGNGHSGGPPLFGPIVRYKQPDPPRRSLVGVILRGFGWLALALAVVASGAAGGAYLYLHKTLADIGPRSAQIKHIVKTKELQTVPPPSQAGDRSRGRLRRPRSAQGAESLCRLQLRHPDAAPGRPDERHAVAALVPARPLRADLLLREYAHHDVPHQLRLVELHQRPGRDSRHGGEADRPPHQLPDHARLPRLHADRRPPARRLYERRPAVLHRQGHGHVGDQPPPGLPEARRSPGAVVRPLPPHRQRHLPHRQTAALPRRPEEPGQDDLGLRRPEGDRRSEAQCRDRQGRRRHRDSGRAQVVPRPPLRPAGGPPLPQRDPAQRLPLLRVRGRRRRGVRAAECDPRGGPELPPSRRPRGAGGQHPVRRQAEDPEEEDDEAAQAVEVADLGARPQRRQGRGPGREHQVPARVARLHDEDAALGRPGQRAEGGQQHDRLLRPRAGERAAGRAAASAALRPTRARQADDAPHLELRGASRQPADGRHGRDELPRHAHDPQATEGAAEDAAAGERGPGHDGAAATAGLRRGALPADGAAQGRAVLGAVVDGGCPRVQAAQEPARGRAHVRGRADLRVLADRGEHLEVRADPRQTRPSRSSTSGQKYLVYTTGGAVQRIALVTPQATYWVSNTILNELSNSTMLAIAESLKPLRR